MTTSSDYSVNRCGARTAAGEPCRRRGYGTYSWRGFRCWQHDPFRHSDEGEYAYEEHAR